ncbi:hypothetical protein V6N11_066081 [Hibiscus sabdariffa]|uniref:Uncharacterized protein n=1 Tax=Hibiscus sabdariffa TaxID=183260 RepID=A0ABR2NUS2_9ROSI
MDEEASTTGASFSKGKLHKRGRGRPGRNAPREQPIANDSFSSSNFLNRQHAVSREARVTLDLGKLIEATTNDNKEDTVKAIA